MEVIVFSLIIFSGVFLYLLFDKNKLDEINSIIDEGLAHQKQYSSSHKYLNQVKKKKTTKSTWNKNEKGHTAKVWNRKGYQIKQGENYSYKYYGNLVYTREQVEKESSSKINRNYSNNEDYEDRAWHREMKDIIGQDQSW